MSLTKSTIVRTIQTTTQSAANRALAAAGGAAYAEYLWFRLPSTPSVDRRESRTPVGGTPFTIYGHGLTGARIEVSGRVYGPEGLPVAYLVHGWGGWWQQLGSLVMPLVAAGFRVVAYDAPSQGSSRAGAHGPRSTTVVEMAEALHLAVTAYGPASVVFAHSLGAMASTWARELGVEAGAYVFVAPAVSVQPVVDYFGNLLGLSARRRRQLASRVERHVGVSMGDLDVVGRARGEGASLPPLLAVHDRLDVETPVEGSIVLTDQWPGAELVLTDGMGHRRVLWDPRVVETSVSFAAAAVGAQSIRSITNGRMSGREPSGAIV